MILSSSSKIIRVLMCSTLLIAGCERDEPEILPNVIFKLSVSDNFLRYRNPSVAILSDFHGNVLAIENLNYAGTHELKFQQEKDHTYHLTLFDGFQSFTTYASLSPGTYTLDLNEMKFSSNVGTYSIFSQGLVVQPSGKNISFYYNKTNSEAELWLTKDSSDLFVYWEPFPFDGPRYIYLPVIKKSQSSTIDVTSDVKSFNGVPVTVQNTSGTNIFLYGDNDPDEEKMQYFFSRSGPLTAGENILYVPPSGPQVSYYRTIFSSFDGHTYTSTGTTIATKQKQLTTTVTRTIETNASSIFYSIESDATIIDWSGFSLDSNIHWRILSRPGINMKINLPKLPQSFRNGYDLVTLETLKFSTATLTKDSRLPTYFETVNRHYLRDEKNGSTSYEQIQQSISIQ